MPRSPTPARLLIDHIAEAMREHPINRAEGAQTLVKEGELDVIGSRSFRSWHDPRACRFLYLTAPPLAELRGAGGEFWCMPT